MEILKRPIGLWIFGIGGLVTNIYSIIIFSLMFYMYAMAFFWIQFIAIIISLLLLLFISLINLFKLKAWGRNIFVIITSIMNFLISSLLIVLGLSGGAIALLIKGIIFIFFVISFIIYFLRPSVRKLFK